MLILFKLNWYEKQEHTVQKDHVETIVPLIDFPSLFGSMVSTFLFFFYKLETPPEYFCVILDVNEAWHGDKHDFFLDRLT